MLGRAGALGRRVAAQHDALRALPPPQPMCAAAAPLLNSRWLDAAAGNSSVVAAQSGSAVRWRGFASGNSGALTTIQGKTSLSSTARALLVDTMEMVSCQPRHCECYRVCCLAVKAQEGTSEAETEAPQLLQQ